MMKKILPTVAAALFLSAGLVHGEVRVSYGEAGTPFTPDQYLELVMKQFASSDAGMDPLEWQDALVSTIETATRALAYCRWNTGNDGDSELKCSDRPRSAEEELQSIGRALRYGVTNVHVGPDGVDPTAAEFAKHLVVTGYAAGMHTDGVDPTEVKEFKREVVINAFLVGMRAVTECRWYPAPANTPQGDFQSLNHLNTTELICKGGNNND